MSGLKMNESINGSGAKRYNRSAVCSVCSEVQKDNNENENMGLFCVWWNGSADSVVGEDFEKN